MTIRVHTIIIKEFRQKARGLSTVGLLTFFLGVIALVSYMVLLSGYSSISINMSSAGAVGRSLAISVLLTQLILTVVFGLSLNGSAITQERDRETLDLLNLTLLPNSDIIFGKMLSSMLFIMLLLFAGLPFFALSYTFGGWELSELGSAIAIELSAVFLVSTCGLSISVASRDTRSALGRTFAVLVFAIAGTLYFGIRLLGVSLIGLDPFHNVMGVMSLLLNPAFALLSVLYPDMQQSISTANPMLANFYGAPFWLTSIAFQFLIGILALLIAIKQYAAIRKGER
jgi:ABC-type Na+ efflux pump permease subunit